MGMAAYGNELSTAQAIVSTVVDALPSDAPKVLEVRVRIGVLTGIVPEALVRAYDLAARETPLADSALNVERAPVVIHCPQCDADRLLAGTADLCCPVCGTRSDDVRDGKDMEILSLVLDD